MIAPLTLEVTNDTSPVDTAFFSVCLVSYVVKFVLQISINEEFKMLQTTGNYSVLIYPFVNSFC